MTDEQKEYKYAVHVGVSRKISTRQYENDEMSYNLTFKTDDPDEIDMDNMQATLLKRLDDWESGARNKAMAQTVKNSNGRY